MGHPTRLPPWRSAQPSRTPYAREKPGQPRPQVTEPPGSPAGSCRAFRVSCLAPCKKEAQPPIASRRRPRGKILAGVKGFRDAAHIPDQFDFCPMKSPPIAPANANNRIVSVIEPSLDCQLSKTPPPHSSNKMTAAPRMMPAINPRSVARIDFVPSSRDK